MDWATARDYTAAIGSTKQNARGAGRGWRDGVTPECTGMAEDTPMSLVGRVAVVTGASRGIGAAIAGRLVGEGATVAWLDSDLPLARRRRGSAD